MEIFEDFNLFIQEHRRCGELESGICGEAETADVMWMDCSCGGHMAKLITPMEDDSN